LYEYVLKSRYPLDTLDCGIYSNTWFVGRDYCRIHLATSKRIKPTQAAAQYYEL
jgi:hypothetical protein